MEVSTLLSLKTETKFYLAEKNFVDTSDDNKVLLIFLNKQIQKSWPVVTRTDI